MNEKCPARERCWQALREKSPAMRSTREVVDASGKTVKDMPCGCETTKTVEQCWRRIRLMEGPMKDLYQFGERIFRIYDPVADKFCCSGRGLYATNGRSVWFGRSAAIGVAKGLPQEIRERAVIKEYRLVEVGTNEPQE